VTDAESLIHDLSAVPPGVYLEVWMGGMLRHRGVVDESAPHLGVVWIQEWGTGMRIMVDLSETELRPSPAPRAEQG